ncbi:MAG TPA: CinA family nicotinamide mononucleotide deamidase-related protein [Kofleriaceae bacterium]|nr:CinA family nicotinamide mononucleotide deamidase-related protein [Kofleriaceae bacterium]
MHAEILTIGDELCRGEIVDTNSSYLAGRLWDLGITTRWMTSCCDDEADIGAALTQAVRRAQLVVCSGGLGPTEDDLTVDVAARLAGVAPVIDEPARRRMEAWFAGRTAVTPIQLRQVRVPAGARVYENPVGLAPCFEVAIEGVPVICLPGFPREIHATYDRSLEARLVELREAAGVRERIARQIYRVFGRGESQISEACRGIVDAAPGTTIHYQVKFPETLVKLVVRDADEARAAARLAALDAELRQRLAPYLYATGDENLVERTVRRLIATKTTVATAESCTGGMIGELLTRMPGSSAAFAGGAITYSNAEKIRQLGVSSDTLAAHGAVSEPTVREMAAGALERFGTDLAVSVSGVAGPDGGTPDKPVGTVWLALAARGAPGDRIVATRKLAWPSTRDQVRTLGAWWALALVDAAIPSTDPSEAARASWILEPRGKS